MRELFARPWAIPALLAFAALVVSVWIFDPKLGPSGDNTEFVTLARSMAAGEGLTYTHLPEPRPTTKYPFGFPLLLAPIAAIFGAWEGPGSGTPDWIAMKVLVVVTFIAAILFCYLLARQQAGTGVGVATALLVMTNPLVASYGHQVMSEVPYIMASLAALWMLERGIAMDGWRDNRYLWAGIALAIASYYLRSVGLVLVGATVATLLLRRDWQRSLLLGGSFVAAMLPLVLRNHAVGGGGFYLRQLMQVNPYFPDRGYLDATGLWNRIQHHFNYYLKGSLAEALWPVLPGGDHFLNLGSIVVIGITGAAVYLCWRRQQHLLLLIYTVFTTGTVMLWPWAGNRFFLPAIPVALFLGLRVIQAVMEWAAQRLGVRSTVFGIAAVAVVLAGNLRELSHIAESSRRDYAPEWRNYLDAGLWLRANTPSETVVACRKAFWMHVVSGRRTTVYAFKPSAELIADLTVKGVSHVVYEQLGFRSTRQFLFPALEEYKDRFEVKWLQPTPQTVVLSFR
ncbi:MAG: glycosyltransferase family 39 protein [Candidatus Latescibacterota bacterium]|nr:glycosyltransferase family 39 protein [Candidatus Latescibacterota bacterium]